jgi:hypothetical protein
MTSLREKRHREVSNTLNRAIGQRDICLAKLVRCEIRVKELRRQLQRLEKAMAAAPTALPGASPPPSPPSPLSLPDAPVEVRAMVDTAIGSDESAIPEFLQRKSDTEIATELKAQAAERKVTKSRVRVQKMLAKKAGDTKKMPLTGKAALAFIRGA